jgi:hypothetical protein
VRTLKRRADSSCVEKHSPRAPFGGTLQRTESVARNSQEFSASAKARYFIMLDVTRTSWYFQPVIVGYRDKRTRDFAAGKRVKAFSAFERSARLKLDRLESATSLRDLAALPGNRFKY